MGPTLVHSLEGYGSWRQELAQRIETFRHWLRDHQLSNAQIDLRLTRIGERLSDDRLTVAFVAEFSRGKSELINAIFFADYGRRLLPTSAGRTTMCPSELKWDPDQPPTLQLLPIETRKGSSTVREYKRYPDEWLTFQLDVTSPDSMAQTLQRIRETKQVPIGEAHSLGLMTQFDAAANGDPRAVAAAPQPATVEIPRWRHALINFPHPLLAHGLVILDTPGLNAIGIEPELTLDLLPNAHAVLFLLALDTGVSQTDINVWRDFIFPNGGRDACRFAVLNKIDTLWDGLRTEEEIEAEVLQQVSYCASTLAIDPSSVFPVSAQRALLAKIRNDEPMLQRSRLPLLEQALTRHLIPRRQEIVRDNTQGELHELLAQTRALIEARLSGIETQRTELLSLRGKNLNVVAHMVGRVREEKAEFERSLQQFQAVRAVFSQHSNLVLWWLGTEALSRDAKQTLMDVQRSKFTPSVRSALNGYFERSRTRLERAAEKLQEVERMMQALYQRFDSEHQLKLGSVPTFSMVRYRKEFQRLEALYNRHFNTTFTMLTNEAMTLLYKFFDTIAQQVRRVFNYANRDAEQWLRAAIAPIEAQIHERQEHLRRRLGSIKRVHGAIDTLEDRVRELEDTAARLRKQIDDIERMSGDLDQALTPEKVETEVAVAAA